MLPGYMQKDKPRQGCLAGCDEPVHDHQLAGSANYFCPQGLFYVTNSPRRAFYEGENKVVQI